MQNEGDFVDIILLHLHPVYTLYLGYCVIPFLYPRSGCANYLLFSLSEYYFYVLCILWRLGTEWRVRYLNPSSGKRFSFFQNCKARLWGPPILLLSGYRVYFPDEDRPDREVDYSPASSSEVKNKRICTSVPSFLPSWRG